MCGIAGIYLKRSDLRSTNIPVERLVDELFCQIAERGRHATGYVAASEDGTNVVLEKDDIPAEYFVQLRQDFPDDAKMILCHTRFATQGSTQENENNHPVVYGSTFVTHNGVVYNDDFIFKSEQILRNAEVDSIVFPALLNVYGWDAAETELKKVQGSYAIAAINPVTNPNELMLVRGEHSPLYYVVTRQAIVWASEYRHLKEAWSNAYGTPPKDIRCLQEGQIVRVKDDTYTLERYMERKTYTSYGYGTQHNWWDRYDDNDDTDTTRTTSTTRYSGVSNLDCIECGVELGTRRINGKHETDNTVTEWSVWVCQTCHTIVDGDFDNLSWRHADKDSVMTKIYDKPEPKSIGTVLASDPNVDRFLKLNPGEVIPEDLLYCFKEADCEACGFVDVYSLDSEGMPQCKDCHDMHEVVDNRSFDDMVDAEVILNQCDGCTLMTSVLRHTDSGDFCDFCVKQEGNYDVCSTCNTVKKSTDFVYRQGKATCSTCRVGEDLSDPRLLTPETTEEDYADIVNRLFRLHTKDTPGFIDRDLAVKKVASEAGLDHGALSWLLYHSSLQQNYLLDDLRAMYGLRVMDAEAEAAVEAEA